MMILYNHYQIIVDHLSTATKQSLYEGFQILLHQLLLVFFAIQRTIYLVYFEEREDLDCILTTGNYIAWVRIYY